MAKRGGGEDFKRQKKSYVRVSRDVYIVYRDVGPPLRTMQAFIGAYGRPLRARA